MDRIDSETLLEEFCISFLNYHRIIMKHAEQEYPMSEDENSMISKFIRTRKKIIDAMMSLEQYRR